MHHYACFPLFDFSVTEVTCMTVEVKGTAVRSAPVWVLNSTSIHQTWQQASAKLSCQFHYLFGSRAFLTYCIEVFILHPFLGRCSTRLRIVACIFLINKMPFFHDRKLEDFVLRKKQHKEPQWTGRLLFYFLKSITFFL